MTPWIDDLNDGELRARLAQRGIPEHTVARLVRDRDDWNANDVIAGLLDDAEAVA